MKKSLLTLGVILSIPFIVSACGSASAEAPNTSCQPPVTQPIGGKNDNIILSDKVREVINLEIKKCELLTGEKPCSMVITSILGVPAFSISTPRNVIVSEDLYYPVEKARLEKQIIKYTKVLEEQGGKYPVYIDGNDD